MSLVDEPGEFQERKVGVLGAAAAFISSLSIGQDMTRVSLPAIFFLPYSNLEMVASRTLGYFDFALRANRETDPEARLLHIVRWMLALTKKENIHKKPFNPIVGETHRCWSTSPEFGTTVFFAEQVSHHPPVSAFVIYNEQEHVRLEGNCDYGIHFHGNSASVETKGELKLTLSNGDEYVFSKILPPLMVKNVVLGTKRLVWEGRVELRSSTGLSAQFDYSEQAGWTSTTNSVAGIISAAAAADAAEPLYTFEGVCGEAITLVPRSGAKARQTLLEPADSWRASRVRIEYGTSESWDALSSLRVWKEVNTPIVSNDMYAADVAKRAIEDAQRARRAAGTSYEPIYFRRDPGSAFWRYTAGTSLEAVSELLERKPLQRRQPAAAPSSPAPVGPADDDDDDVVLQPTVEENGEQLRNKLLELAVHDDIEPPANADVSALAD
eukprot:TRINITY_DN323_c0_g1_i1.p1 TRINITY_DN323_c0_g1~~TRINITY_DN323_c0_g1_i1.p1  ORF type:complete len:439 (-),score=194.21 TRINITY_DN323_c0_g1_i1:968-2284(-)